MKDKIALVTGGMGGIGTAICQHLTKLGSKVIASYNQKGNHEAAKAWQLQQKNQGLDIAIQYVDVTDFYSCEAMIKNIEAEQGHIDILVNNAGITCDVQL
ncbi:MAG TPA: SDR family NAD(P)-dependent oxidoreductase, partial [Candidatus Dojkabacteria bacterium]|nr:SDR family NAD(P)-dependent oxidoreductase [Candidatus Dojkabacteria bacterium]